VEAMGELAMVYTGGGLGLYENKPEALRWLVRAAEAGSPWALVTCESVTWSSQPVVL
jgi:hypothetical protein